MKFYNLFSIFSETIHTFFTQGDARSIKAKKNILILSVVKGLSILISLVMLPLTLHYINPTRYGIWLTLTSIIGWFSFFDIGFGNGLRNKFAESVAKGDDEKARIYVSTTYAVLSIIIAIILLFFLLVNPLLDWSKLLNAPADMNKELSSLVIVVFVFFCVTFILRLINTVLTANQQPAKASIFDLVSNLISLSLIFILTKTTSGNLIYLGTVFSISPVLVLGLSSIWFYSNQYKKYAPSFKYVKFRYARDLMTLGLKFFIIQIAAILLYQTNNIIIAQLFGPDQVTPFHVSYRYFGIVTMASGIIMLPFWSAFTEAWTKKDVAWIKNTMKKLRSIWSFLIVAVIVMLVFSDFIFKLWIGDEVKVPIQISIVMAVYVIINTWNAIYSYFLNGVGKIKLQLYAGIFAAILNIPFAIFLGKYLGIYGIILATSILALGSAVWSPIQYKKIIEGRAKGIWNK